MGIFDKFKIGFKKSADAFSSGLKEIIVKREIDDENLNKIEDFLIASDVGVDAANEIRNIISQKKIDPNKEIINEVNDVLKNYIINLMQPLERKDFFNSKSKLNIILVSGVNGVGKTTSIGKIGKKFKENKNKVLFSACDTFRAAAIDQLEQWANKIKVEIVKSDPGSDPASVAFKSLEVAKKDNYNEVIIDTAGRLQNKKNLMEEYKKIAKVIGKFDDEAPHEVLLVLDATSGQNVINQVEEFNKIIPLTGLIMTKLDGTAKGGVLIAAARKFKIPIIALGLGEKEDDLEIFDSEIFASTFVRTN
jgi:fused signal recognition particle receptor